MAIGKTLRFEIFARDAFTCQYCGRRPPDVVLEVDHIHPQSKGGLDEPVNLITSCFDCNRGKRDRLVSEVAPRPDADLMFLRVQQEIAEAERYLAAKKKRDKVQAKVRDVLMDLWREQLDSDPPTLPIWNSWINKYGCEEIEIAITKTGARARFGDLAGGSSANKRERYGKYVSAILRDRWEAKEKK